MYDAIVCGFFMPTSPRLDAVGAAFAYHATDKAVNFGKGSTVSYITDKEFWRVIKRLPLRYRALIRAAPVRILQRVGVTDFTLLREFPFIYDGSVSSLGTVRSTSEDGKMRLFFSELIRLPGNRPATAIIEDTLYQAIMSRAHISTTAVNVGSVWSAIVRAVAGHYGLSVDTGRFARWYVASSYGSATPFSGTMATDVDRGILNLIAGLIDISDGTITAPSVLRHMTHGIAPSANLNVLTTYGMRPDTTSTNKWIGTPGQGFVNTSNSGKNLPRLASRH